MVVEAVVVGEDLVSKGVLYVLLTTVGCESHQDGVAAVGAGEVFAYADTAVG